MKRLELISSKEICFDLSFDMLKAEASKRWGNFITKHHPSFVPRRGDEVLFFSVKRRKGAFVHSLEMIDAITSAGMFLPNVHGLIIAEKIINETEIKLPPYPVWIAGYDFSQCLYCLPKLGHMVPHLLVEDRGFYDYHMLPYDAVIEHDELIMAIKR